MFDFPEEQTPKKQKTQYFQVLFDNSNTDKIKSVLENAKEADAMRTKAIILSANKYKFNDPKTDRVIQGISFEITDGFIQEGETGEKGLSLNKYSISGEKAYNEFGQLPNPPFIAVVEFKMSPKRNVLTSIFPINIQATKNTEPKAEGKGGAK